MPGVPGRRWPWAWWNQCQKLSEKKCGFLVLTDHFMKWQNAIALSEATFPAVASALDECVFCYMYLPGQIHTDQGAV